MNILYVYAHPSASSFNHKLKAHAQDSLGKHAMLLNSDLYAMHFNAVASWEDFDLDASALSPQYFFAQQQAYKKHKLAKDITAEIEKLARADHIIFQFPLWWFSAPAILKGWLDRVLVKGFAYDTGKTFDDGLLKGKTASCIVTTQSPEAAYQVNGIHGATMDAFLHSIHHTLRFVGMTIQAPFVVYGAFNLDAAREAQIMKDMDAYLNNLLAPVKTR